MNIETFRALCLQLPATTESFPFDDVTLVFKVAGKMYALASLDSHPFSVNLKCDPERAVQLRADWPEDVKPGYHMNKKHWNTVIFEGNLPEDLLRELLKHSYDLVVRGLPKRVRDELREL